MRGVCPQALAGTHGSSLYFQRKTLWGSFLSKQQLMRYILRSEPMYTAPPRSRPRYRGNAVQSQLSAPQGPASHPSARNKPRTPIPQPRLQVLYTLQLKMAQYRARAKAGWEASAASRAEQDASNPAGGEGDRATADSFAEAKQALAAKDDENQVRSGCCLRRTGKHEGGTVMSHEVCTRNQYLHQSQRLATSLCLAIAETALHWLRGQVKTF